MNMREAIETMKIIGSYSEDIAQENRHNRILLKLLRAILKRNPTDSVRLLSLMYHVSVEAIAEDFQTAEGIDYIKALTKAFRVNPLPDLVNAAKVLGLSEVEWPNARAG
jgi:hypothetical protein